MFFSGSQILLPHSRICWYFRIVFEDLKIKIEPASKMTVSRSNQLKETTDEGNEKLIIIVSIIKFIAVTSWRNHQQKKNLPMAI